MPALNPVISLLDLSIQTSCKLLLKSIEEYNLEETKPVSKNKIPKTTSDEVEKLGSIDSDSKKRKLLIRRSDIREFKESLGNKQSSSINEENSEEIKKQDLVDKTPENPCESSDCGDLDESKDSLNDSTLKRNEIISKLNLYIYLIL